MSSNLRTRMKSHRHASQEAVIRRLNPGIRGWARDDAGVGRARLFQRRDHRRYGRLHAWAAYRPPNNGTQWIAHRYGSMTAGHGWSLQPPQGGPHVYRHGHTPIRRHVKGHGGRRPYEGDGGYGSPRLGHHPEVAPRVARLLKRPHGTCPACGLFFAAGDRMEVDHSIPQACGGSEGHDNLQWLHRHCHDRKTANDAHRLGTSDKRHVTEEPCEGPTLMHGFGAESVSWSKTIGLSSAAPVRCWASNPLRPRHAPWPASS
jgi:RNA-directed DNA polymerase